jgi:hypothetical protein
LNTQEDEIATQEDEIEGNTNNNEGEVEIRRTIITPSNIRD